MLLSRRSLSSGAATPGLHSQEAEHRGKRGCSPAPFLLPQGASETERQREAGLGPVIAHEDVSKLAFKMMLLSARHLCSKYEEKCLWH